MKKIILLIILILLLAGCGYEDNANINAKNSCLETYCDKKYNIEYIRDVCYQSGGITARFDKNGKVVHCK